MTQLVKILSAAKRPPNEQQVVALLHDDTIPQTRQIVANIQAGFDARDHVQANFDSLWADGLVSNQWDAETDKEDIRDKATAALDTLNQAIATLDDSPTNAEVIAIVRYFAVLHRKEVRVLADLLTE